MSITLKTTKMKDNELKYMLHRDMRFKYGVVLTQAQLDDIHDYYHESRKQTIKIVAFYRLINLMLSAFFLILFFATGQNVRESWFLFTVLSLFFFYNQIHGIINWVQYKRIKQPKRPSDE